MDKSSNPSSPDPLLHQDPLHKSPGGSGHSEPPVTTELLPASTPNPRKSNQRKLLIGLVVALLVLGGLIYAGVGGQWLKSGILRPFDPDSTLPPSSPSALPSPRSLDVSCPEKIRAMIGRIEYYNDVLRRDAFSKIFGTGEGATDEEACTNARRDAGNKFASENVYFSDQCSSEGNLWAPSGYYVEQGPAYDSDYLYYPSSSGRGGDIICEDAIISKPADSDDGKYHAAVEIEAEWICCGDLAPLPSTSETPTNMPTDTPTPTETPTDTPTPTPTETPTPS